MKRLIVIGNGPIPYPQGERIDKFDTVIRLSNYKIEGFEELVGTKTDIWCVGSIIISENKTPIIWSGNPKGIFGASPDDIGMAYGDRLRLMDQNLANRIYTELSYKPFGDLDFHPTLGIFAIFRALELAKHEYEIPITITGFTFSDPTQEMYYWTDIIKNGPAVLEKQHNYVLERSLIAHYIKEGMVKFLKWGE